MPDQSHVLIATLGGQPQVVTFTLDLLLGAGFPIREVFVVHPKASNQSHLANSLLRLNTEFVGQAYPAAGRVIHLHSCVLEMDKTPIDDICNEAQADGTLNTLHRLISDLKHQGSHIHLSITGGRRLISLLAIPVALFNFDRHDYIWHLYTPDALQKEAKDGAIMHTAPDAGLKLIQGPFIPLGAYIYDPHQPFRVAQEERHVQIKREEHTRCSEVVTCATPSQLKVLQAFARGLKPQQVADELCITLATVNTHKTALFVYCHAAWNIPEEERLTYHFLAIRFADFFAE
jgi:CRISPR-associated protein Csx14